ncbi:MAG: acetate--CoA ligase family protein [Rhodospirillales bacterium]
MADEMNDRSSSLVQALFTPRGVALIGASGDPTKNSGRPQRFLKSHGFTGAVYPINPGRDEVQGVPAFKSVADVPGPVDHAFVMVPAQHVEDAIRQCGEKGVPVATIYSDGFAETGEDGRKMQERLVATARKAGVRLIGPNSMGVIHPASSLTLSVNAVLEMEGIKPGGLSLISQSGTILGTLLSRGAARGIGFARMISVGNESDLGVGELVDLLVDDPDTTSILLFVEAVRDGAVLARAARRAFDAGKPVIAYKLGRSEAGRELALSHSGAIAGPAKAADAYFQAHSIARVEMLEGLLESPPLFLGHRPAKGKRVAVVTTTGGGAASVADRLGSLGATLVPAPDSVRAALRDHGLEIGRGPLVDLTMAGTREGVYGAALENLLADDGIDAVVCVVGSSGQFKPELAVAPIVEKAAGSSKPVAAFIAPQADKSLTLLQDAGIANFRTPEACADAVMAFLNRTAPRPVPDVDGHAKTRAEEMLERAPSETLNEREASLVFEALGLPIAPAQVIKEAGEPIAVPFPVAAKVLARDIQHKTERGLVKLGIEAPEDFWDQAEQLLAAAPEAEGILVQSMAQGVMGEVIAGYRLDQEAGPIVLVGPGGIMAEVYDDAAVRTAPVDVDEAMAMIEEVKGLAPIRGFRGKPAGDLKALAQAIAALSNLAVLEAPVLEAEINPLMIRGEGEGVVAVDALLRLKSS